MMPSKPLRPCKHIACPNLVSSGYCEEHKKDERAYDKNRGNANQRGYTYRWNKYRLTFLSKNPLCVECGKEGIIKPATVVDHIIPHKGNNNLFWDSGNHQALCKRCHDIKTVKEDGGFGRQ